MRSMPRLLTACGSAALQRRRDSGGCCTRHASAVVQRLATGGDASTRRLAAVSVARARCRVWGHHRLRGRGVAPRRDKVRCSRLHSGGAAAGAARHRHRAGACRPDHAVQRQPSRPGRHDRRRPHVEAGQAVRADVEPDRPRRLRRPRDRSAVLRRLRPDSAGAGARRGAGGPRSPDVEPGRREDLAPLGD